MKKLIISFILILCTTFGSAQVKNQITFTDGTIAYVVKGNDGFFGVENVKGKTIVPSNYGKITSLGNTLYCQEARGVDFKQSSALYKKDGTKIFSEKDGYSKLEYISFEGQSFIVSLTTSTIWDENGTIKYKYNFDKDNRGFGYLVNTLTDTLVIQPGKYTELSLNVDGIHTTKGNKKGVCDFDGKVIIEANRYCKLESCNDYLGYLVRLSEYGGNQGYYDHSGKCLIPATLYTEIKPLRNGHFAIISNGRAGIADSHGNIEFMTNYNQLTYEVDKNGNSYYRSYLGYGRGRISLDGKIIEEPEISIEEDEISKDGFQGVIYLGLNGKHGVNDKTGKKILPCEYDIIDYDTRAKGFKLTKNGYVGFANSKGELIIPLNTYDHIWLNFQKIYEVTSKGKKGLLDINGKEIIKPTWDDAEIINDTLTRIKSDLLWGVVDRKGNIKVPIEYTKIRFLNTHYEIELFGKHGILDLDGKIIIPPIYTSVFRHQAFGVDMEYYQVTDGKSKGLIALDGTMIFPTGLFENVIITKNYGFEKNIKEDFFVRAFNDSKEQVCYYNLVGDLLYDNRPDKDYDKFFKLGGEEFDKKNYNNAISYYRKALANKKEGNAYYNIAAAYYNLENYKSAITEAENCISYANSQSLIEKAADLKIRCNNAIHQKKQQRVSKLLNVLGCALNVAATIIEVNNGVQNYNNNYISNRNSYMSGFPDPNVAVRQAMAQFPAYLEQQKNQFLTQYRRNYNMATGRMPTEDEEFQAYYQYCMAMNEANAASNSSSSSSYSTSNNNTSSSTSNSHGGFRCKKLHASDTAHCNDSGVCQKCNGQKYYWDNTFGSRHLVDPCVTCNGTGRCPSCGGR